MSNHPVLHTIQALELAAQLVTHVTQADVPRAPAADSAGQAEYATYLRELSAVTSQWQAHTLRGLVGRRRYAKSRRTRQGLTGLGLDLIGRVAEIDDPG